MTTMRMTMMSKKSTLSGIREQSKVGINEMLIYETLNKLFYTKPNNEAELEMIKYQMEMNQEEREGLHASSISGGSNSKSFCLREKLLSIYFKQDDNDDYLPTKIKRIYEEGNSIGLKWNRLFIRGGIGVKEDMDIPRFDKSHKVYYTPDAIITIQGKKYLVEIKSQSTTSFERDKSHLSGRKQLKLYMHLSGIHQGFVLVENKNDQDFKVLYFEYDENDKEVQSFVDALELIDKADKQFRKKKKMVPRHCDCPSQFSNKAKRCPMAGACWGTNRVRI